MHDFNFFRSYQKPTGKAAALKQNTMIACITIFVLIAGIYSFNGYRIYKLNSEMKQMTEFMTAPENAKLYQKYLKTKDQVAVLNSYFTVTDRINRLIENNYEVNNDMLLTLSNAIPSTISLQSSKINNLTVDFQGLTKNRLAIAEYEHNLIETGLFKEVFVTNIDQAYDISYGVSTADNYLFSIKCELKEGTGL